MFPFFEDISTRAYTDEELEELKTDKEIKLNDNKNISNNSKQNKSFGKSKYLNNRTNKMCNEIYNKYEENGYEYLGLINTINNKQIGDIHTSYKKDQVKLSTKQENLLALEKDRSILLVHNHPNNDTFSKNDIASMIANKKMCGIIATGKDYNYFFEIVEDNPNKIIKFNEIWDEVLFEVKKTIKSNISNSNLLTNEALHNIYSKVFQKRGWNYGRERRL